MPNPGEGVVFPPINHRTGLWNVLARTVVYDQQPSRARASGGAFRPYEVTMAPKDRRDNAPERKPDEAPETDRPHRPVRDVQDDPAPNPDGVKEKSPPETIDEP